VPAEAARFERRVGRRDRLFLAALACAAALAGPAIVLATRDHGTRAREDAACITAAHAGVLGGGTYHYCGEAAVEFCRRFAGDPAVAGECAGLAQPSAGAAAGASEGRRRSQSVAFRNAADTTSRAMMYSQSRITVAAPRAP
jgi:hypothetical protein